MQKQIQNLLSKNYKWYFLLNYNIRLSLAYKIGALSVIVRDLLPMIISLTIYGSFMKTKDFAIYFLLANIFLKVAATMWDISWDIRGDVQSGYLVSKMLRPSNLFLQYLCITIGANFYPFLINLGILLFGIFFIGFSTALTWNIFPVLLLLLFGVIIFYFVEIIVGSISFWFTEISPLIECKNILIPFLAGSLVFLNTNYITKFFIYTPFSFAVHHPMQIYLNKYSPLETFYVFLGGIFWCIFLYFLAKLVFKLGLKRNESVGL
jgi:ABC-2 type transport system permease protein